MKEYSVKLTEREIETLMYALEGYSAHCKLQAAQGLTDKEKTKDLTDRLCELNSKFYRKLLQIHNVI